MKEPDADRGEDISVTGAQSILGDQQCFRAEFEKMQGITIQMMGGVGMISTSTKGTTSGERSRP